MDLPHPWGAYGRLQEQLAHRRQVDDHSWALEAGLNSLLATPQTIPTEEAARRTVRSHRRKERHRRGLLASSPVVEHLVEHTEAAIDARQRLRLVESQTTAADWALLRAVGEGYKYQEIAVLNKVAAGALRARVLRLRRSLARRVHTQLTGPQGQAVAL